MSQKEVKIMASKPNVYVVIPASGEGERFGSKTPKQVWYFFVTYLLGFSRWLSFTVYLLQPVSEYNYSLKYFLTDRLYQLDEREVGTTEVVIEMKV